VASHVQSAAALRQGQGVPQQTQRADERPNHQHAKDL
jgi:hypothetical protein